VYSISKWFQFSASHSLDLPPEHPCSRVHGHNYKVQIVLAASGLNQNGFIIDFGELRVLGDWLDSELDHQHLNDVLDFNPTSENLAKYIFDWCAERWSVLQVRVSETEKTWAEYAR